MIFRPRDTGMIPKELKIITVIATDASMTDNETPGEVTLAAMNISESLEVMDIRDPVLEAGHLSTTIRGLVTITHHT